MKHLVFVLSLLALGITSCENDDSLGSVGLYAFPDATGKWGYIDKDGLLKLEPQWDEAYDFYNGLGTVYLNGKAGMINKDGEAVIPLKYDNIYQFSIELVNIFDPTFLAVTEQNGLFGFVNEKGVERIPFIYEWVSEFSNGMACVYIDGKFGYIDQDGNLDIPAIYDGHSYFSQDLCWVGKLVDNVMKWGVIDKSNNTRIPFEYEGMYGNTNELNVHRFVNGISPFKKGGKFGFLRTDGTYAVDPIYAWANFFTEGLAVVAQNNMGGFVNESFNLVIPIKYFSASFFWQGFSYVRLSSGDNYSFINKSGVQLGTDKYTYAYNFNDCLAWVKFLDGTVGYINKSGETVWKGTDPGIKGQKYLNSRKVNTAGVELER